MPGESQNNRGSDRGRKNSSSPPRALTVSSHTDAIHIGDKETDGSRMTLPR